MPRLDNGTFCGDKKIFLMVFLTLIAMWKHRKEVIADYKASGGPLNRRESTGAGSVAVRKEI